MCHALTFGLTVVLIRKSPSLDENENFPKSRFSETSHTTIVRLNSPTASPEGRILQIDPLPHVFRARATRSPAAASHSGNKNRNPAASSLPGTTNRLFSTSSD